MLKGRKSREKNGENVDVMGDVAMNNRTERRAMLSERMVVDFSLAISSSSEKLGGGMKDCVGVTEVGCVLLLICM